MSEQQASTIDIYESGEVRTVFAAPADPYMARQLWVFLVENLRPGLEVTLVQGPATFHHATGQKLPLALYKRVMSAAEEA